MTTVQGDVKDQESIRDLKATPVQKDATTPNIITCRTQQCWEFVANNVASVCTGLNLHPNTSRQSFKLPLPRAHARNKTLAEKVD